MKECQDALKTTGGKCDTAKAEAGINSDIHKTQAEVGKNLVKIAKPLLAMSGKKGSAFYLLLNELLTEGIKLKAKGVTQGSAAIELTKILVKKGIKNGVASITLGKKGEWVIDWYFDHAIKL
jgi:hypothetical protein